MDLPDIELVAAKVHEAWIDTKLAQGITTRPSATGIEQMVPYADLPDDLQELDRSTMRAVYAAIRVAGREPAAETPRLQQILDEFNQVQIAQTRAIAIHGLAEALYRQEQIVEELQAKLAETPRPAATWQDERTLAVVAKMIDEDQRPPIEMLKEMVRILRLKESSPASDTGQASAWQPIENIVGKNGDQIVGGYYYGDRWIWNRFEYQDGWFSRHGGKATHVFVLPLAPSEDETTRTERINER